jgi:hypothetical protein
MEHPIAPAGWLVGKAATILATVNNCLGHLKCLGIVCELIAQKRNRLFSYGQGYGDPANTFIRDCEKSHLQVIQEL